MSYSFVLIDLNNKCNLEEIYSFISSNYSDYEILYCSTKNTDDKENLTCYSFEEKTETEAVVNSILCKTNKENIVLIRKFESCEKIKEMTDKINENEDVVYLYKEKKGIVKFFDKCINQMASLVYGQAINDINCSAIAYGKTISQVIKTLNYPSKATRSNNWTGVKKNYVECNNKYKIKYSKKYIVFTLIPLIISILAIVMWFVLKSRFGFRFNLLTAFVVLGGFIFFVIFANMWYYKAHIGENITEKAKYKLNKGE